MLIGGCKHTVIPVIVVVTVVKVQQPDGPPGANVHFTMTGTHVTGCTGGGGWPACLDVGTYSSAFQFTTDRVIAK